MPVFSFTARIARIGWGEPCEPQRLRRNNRIMYGCAWKMTCSLGNADVLGFVALIPTYSTIALPSLKAVWRPDNLRATKPDRLKTGNTLNDRNLTAPTIQVSWPRLPTTDTGLEARIIRRNSRARKRGWFACMAYNGGPCGEPQGSPGSW